QVHVPVTLLNDAGLPRLENGNVDASASEAALQVVAADVVRNLDMRLAKTPLMATRVEVRLAPGGQSVDIEISFALIGGSVGLSARLNAFQGRPLQPPRTDVSYQPASGPLRFLTLTGPPTRVAFDPDLGDIVPQFAARGFDIVLAGGSHLLFLICLFLPTRTTRESSRLVATLLAAQAVGILIVKTMPASLAWLDLVAWSVVIAVALCGIVGASPRTFLGLSVLFGLLSGVGLGASFNEASQLSGSHVAAALLTFILVSLAAEVWLTAVMLATRHWLASLARYHRIVTILAAALVVHIAVHRVVDRGHELAQAGSFAASHAVLLLILGWALVMVSAAVARLVTGSAPVSDSSGAIR
ncbi:MAG TPA: hypothetical protein VF219_06100, partial [Vicinamibacterales bacterium]